MTDKQETNHAFARSRSNAWLGDAFKNLSSLPPEHEYWKNKWMFTRPVFLNESRQGSDQKKFWLWVVTLPSGLMKYIYEAPNVKVRGRPLLGDPS